MIKEPLMGSAPPVFCDIDTARMFGFIILSRVALTVVINELPIKFPVIEPITVSDSSVNIGIGMLRLVAMTN
jgi:hypothetical protein